MRPVWLSPTCAGSRQRAQGRANVRRVAPTCAGSRQRAQGRRSTPADSCTLARFQFHRTGIFSRKERRMVFTLARRAPRHRFVHCLRRNAVCALIPTFLLLAPPMASAQAEGDFEQPPVLNVSDLVSKKELLQGQG